MMNLSDMINLPIGFMDSGLGGLSVLREAIRILPNEDFIYYGDSKNAPYGTKKTEEIRKLTFNVVEKLLDQGIKALVIACNTATGAAISALRDAYPNLPIIGIEPAIKPAVVHNHGGRILVMATPMTIRQQKFHELLDVYKGQAEIVPVQCEGLMEFVEHGDLDGDVLDEYFKEHLSPYITKDTETIVLGCTHYPFLSHHLKAFLNNNSIKLIDGSLGTSLELKRQLDERNLLHTSKRQSQITIQNSIDSPKMLELSHKLLKMPIE